MDLPGPLKVLGNRKLFFIFAGAAGVAMVLGVLLSAFVSPEQTGLPMQGGEAPDVAVEDQQASDGSTPTPTEQPASNVSDAPAARLYKEPPEMTIDTNRTYLATITTPKGEIQIELYPSEAPEAVNAFVFLAQEGYYNGTQFMELVRDQDGSRFYAQAGDPTATGYGTPGFSVRKERTDLPFERGAVGMGGTAENSNGGQFFISFGDYPALDGKYTVFGRVVDGLDVLDSLDLLDLTGRVADGRGDTIESITITES